MWMSWTYTMALLPHRNDVLQVDHGLVLIACPRQRAGALQVASLVAQCTIYNTPKQHLVVRAIQSMLYDNSKKRVAIGTLE